MDKFSLGNNYRNTKKPQHNPLYISSGHIHINWMSPFPILGVSGVNFSLFCFQLKFLKPNCVVPHQTPCLVASDLGLYCLPTGRSQKGRYVQVV